VTRKRENMMSYSKIRYKKRCRTFYRLVGKRCTNHFKAYTRIGARIGTSTITIIIGQTMKYFWLAQPSWGIIVVEHLQLL
jgi:hypothetical protein